MKPVIRDRGAYPDVSHQLVDLVSQQPAPQQPEGVRVKRLGTDEYRALQAAGLTKLDALLQRSPHAPSPMGYVPRPAGWNVAPAIFQDAEMRQKLQSAGIGLRLSARLDEILGQVAGQITDLKAAAADLEKFLPADFNGLIFKGNGIDSYDDPVQYIQERSIHTLDELRNIFSSGGGQGSLLHDSLQKATALLQIRAKLNRLGNLAEMIERGFAELTLVDAGKLKAPVLC